MSQKKFTIEKTERLPDSEAKIAGEISLEFLNSSRVEAIKHINEHLDLPGFRKGQIPESVLIKTVGEMGILEEAAEVAMAKAYGEIILESGLKPITRPEIRILKLAPGIPLSFEINVVLEPEFDLPDYKKISKEVLTAPKQKAEEAEGKDAPLENSQFKIMEAIVKETKIDFPKRFLESEASHMISHFKHDLDKAGLKWEEYLEKVKKTEDEVRESFKEQISYRAKAELVIAKIAEKENLKTYGEVLAFLAGEEKKS